MLTPVPQLPGPPLMCGPTAICAVTGIDQYDVLAVAHRYMGRPLDRPIRGMTDVQLTGTLALLGYRCSFTRWVSTKHGGPPNVGQWARSVAPFKGAVILSLTKHYCACTYDEYLCNHTDGQPVPIAQAPNLRTRIHTLINVRPL